MTNNIEDLLNEYKKGVKRSGILTELNRRTHFEKPSRKRKLKRIQALARSKRDAKRRAYLKGEYV